MSEYESQKWNLSLFRLPLLWFLVVAFCAQLFIAIHNTAHVAEASPPAKVAVPQVYAASQGPAVAPIKVELPVRTIKKEIVTKPKPHTAVAIKQAKAKGLAPPSIVASGSVETVIQFAMAQLGKPYVWGATGPNSYDCSGLVMTAFSKIGIKLPRTTRTMIGAGHQVNRAGLQRGDIVFPSSGHVGIYLGDNKFIHAPQPGQSVKISNVYAFYSARRLV